MDKKFESILRKIETFDISRSVWLRGDQNSYLLRQSDNKRCCLGIYLNVCGVSDDLIYNVNSPAGITVIPLPEQCSWLKEVTSHHNGFWNSTLSDFLMNVNDRLHISEEERESLISIGFAEAGIRVNFVD